MAAASLQTVVKHLRSLAANGLTNHELLQRFVMDADDDAFAALVRRHGRLVLSVCRRVLGPDSEVDDVFQATFVVLARKASSIRKQPSVASWLYGVAYHLATKVRGKRSRRRRREITSQVVLDQLPENETMHTDPVGCASLRELGTIMDEEMQRLPPTCRDAVVTCLMLGLSHTEAAKQLGWPLGTLKTRLQRGRELLRERLERRGAGLSAVAVTVVLAEQARAIVPATLMRATIEGAAHQSVSATALALANGAMRTLGATTIKLAVFSTLAVGAIGFGASALPIAGTKAEAPVLSTRPAKIQAKEQSVRTDAFGDPLPPGAIARLGTVRWRHGAPVHFLAFLPDGKSVISAADDRYVRVWELDTGKELRRFGPGPKTNQNTAKFQYFDLVGGLLEHSTVAAVSSDGKLLATCFEQPVVDLWELATGKKLGAVPLENATVELAALAFAPHNNRLAMVSADGLFRLWDIDKGKMVREFGVARKEGGGSRQSNLVYAANGKALISILCAGGMKDVTNNIQFWDPESGTVVRTIKVRSELAINSLALSPSGELLAYGTTEGQACIVDAASGGVAHQWKVSEHAKSPFVVFSPDGTKLYSKTTNPDGFVIQEWDVTTARLLRKFATPQLEPPSIYRQDSTVGSLTISPDGKMLASGGDDNAIRFFNVAKDSRPAPQISDAQRVYSLNYTPDGKFLLTQGGFGTPYKLWDAATSKMVKALQAPRKSNLMMTRDGRYAVVRDLEHDTYLLDCESGQKVSELSRQANRVQLAFSPDGRSVLIQDTEAYALIFDIPTGKQRCRVSMPYARKEDGTVDIFDSFFSHDGQRLAVHLGNAGFMMIHDAMTGRMVKKSQIGRLGAVRSGDLSPDGRLLALDCGDGQVQIIELETGAVRRVYGKKIEPESKSTPIGEVGSSYVMYIAFRNAGVTCAFSPDGRLLAFAGPDNVLQLLDAATGQSLARFEGHTGKIGTFDFAPDGRSIATGSTDTTVLIWDIRGLTAKAGLPPRLLDADAVKANWSSLKSGDAKLAGDAIIALIGTPQQATSFLKGQLQPASGVDAAMIAKLIKELDSDQFKVREKAQSQLLEIGNQVLPYLEKELLRNVPLETRQRLEALQVKLTTPLTGDRLRLVRAIEVLERIGNAEARQVLESLAAGAPGALATTEAQAALRRLRTRP